MTNGRAGTASGGRTGTASGGRTGTTAASGPAASPMGNGTGTPAVNTGGHTARPLVISGFLSVLAGMLAVLALANGPVQLPAIGIAAVGLAGLGFGLEIRHRGFPFGGALLAIGGLAAVLAALGWGATLPRDITTKLELVPGLVGLLALVLGLSRVKPGYERWFIGGGAAALLLGVFLSGFVHGASTLALLVATVATVVAWDVGEQAVNMGEHLGRGARTWPVELAHWGVGVLVGVGGVVVAIVIGGLNVTGLPLLGLAALLGAGVVLAIALHT